LSRSGVLLSGTGVLLSCIFNNIEKKEFLCLWSSIVAYKEIFRNYLKYWGSTVGGVLLQSATLLSKEYDKVLDICVKWSKISEFGH
jgi:hypothetical protein